MTSSEDHKVVTLGRRASRLGAVGRGLCPRCRAGRVFRGSVRMNETCPTCHLKFEREPGYFVGAMYISYALAIPILALLTLIVWYLIVPDWPLENAAIVAGVAFLPLVPLVFRYSRILWMHLNWYLDPYE